MSSSRSSASIPKSRSALATRMAFWSQIIMPKPTIPGAGPRTAYMLKKGRRSSVKSGAARISAERRFVKGLGYIRADATPLRPRSSKSRRSDSVSRVLMRMEPVDLEVCAKLVTMSTPNLLDNLPGPSSYKVSGLYDQPRYPSTLAPSI